MSSDATEVEREEEPAGSDPAARAEHRRGLLLIGLLKLSEAMFFVLLGLGALRLLAQRCRRRRGDAVRGAAGARPGRAAGSVADGKVEASGLGEACGEIGFGTFAYSAIKLVEGVGLMLEKLWAEYLTLGLTALALPWELF